MLGAMVYISGGVSSQFGVCVHACVCVEFWLLSSHRRGWRPGQRELDKSVGLMQLRFAGQGLKCLLKECASISHNTLWLLFCRVRTQTELMPTAVLPPYVVSLLPHQPWCQLQGIARNCGRFLLATVGKEWQWMFKVLCSGCFSISTSVCCC